MNVGVSFPECIGRVNSAGGGEEEAKLHTVKRKKFQLFVCMEDSYSLCNNQNSEFTILKIGANSTRHKDQWENEYVLMCMRGYKVCCSSGSVISVRIYRQIWFQRGLPGLSYTHICSFT